MALTGCLATSAPPATSEPERLAPAWRALLPGDSARLTAPAPVVEWRSGNPAVATVDATGLVRAHTLGFAVISAILDPDGRTAIAGIVVTPPVLIGAGDIAVCGSNQNDDATARLLDSIPGIVFTAGDNAYQDGSFEDFSLCYDPTWGRHKNRTRPSPGNHDYHTLGATGYFNYFGVLAGDSGVGYYRYQLGSWSVFSLNSNISMAAGSPQEQWLRDQLSVLRTPCSVAYWHHPRFSSGEHGNTVAAQPLWQALYDAGADVIIAGHDHTYERFAPQSPTGALDSATGIRQFVAGTGGPALYAFPTPAPNSEFRQNTTHGVLKLTLHATSYDWEFIATDAAVMDSGSGACH
ncbi:MAG: metallophosphoesterase [Gemmatimonadales bacterium]|nr:metallophosphoesterase [Gemmatimonadales bacterium]